jgi:23S rRNA pseudoU1915 N3-methylase RlmH
MKHPLRAWRIEGETLTEPQIACRLGCTENTARRRIASVIAGGRGITWRLLGCRGRRK